MGGAGEPAASPIPSWSVIAAPPNISDHKLPVVFWTLLRNGVQHWNSLGQSLWSPSPSPSSDWFLLSYAYLWYGFQNYSFSCPQHEVAYRMSWLYSWSSFCFVAVMKHCDQKQLWGERVDLYTYLSKCNIEGGQGRNSSKAKVETMKRCYLLAGSLWLMLRQPAQGWYYPQWGRTSYINQ